jgi:hypothetical protein
LKYIESIRGLVGEMIKESSTEGMSASINPLDFKGKDVKGDQLPVDLEVLILDRDQEYLQLASDLGFRCVEWKENDDSELVGLK